MAEGAPLLREYVGKTCIEGSNPSDSAKYFENPPSWRVFLWKSRAMRADGRCSFLRGALAGPMCPPIPRLSQPGYIAVRLFVPTIQPTNDVGRRSAPTDYLVIVGRRPG